MISFEQAMKLIADHPLVLSVESRPCGEALGLTLARDVIAPIDLPPFDNSAVDGFALNCASLRDTGVLPIMAEVRAQAQHKISLPHTMTAKIMTGAPVPDEADAVVMKEDVTVVDGRAHIHVQVSPHDNVRFRGEDIRASELVATRNTIVSPQLIGVFHGLGMSHIDVIRPPRVHVISTGDELIDAGVNLQFGQVYYLIGPMLTAQCQSLGIQEITVERVGDNQEVIRQALDRALHADIILLSGGMSKGDYDLVRPALAACGVEEIFYQGAWRPGKPLYFGRRGSQRIFGLPGNPVAAFVGFHIFVRPLIFKALNRVQGLAPKTGIMAADFTKKPGFTLFARALIGDHGEIAMLPGQGSHQVVSLSKAHALALLPEHASTIKAGEVVRYYVI
jgi:molybdopterin molybdotransferase